MPLRSAERLCLSGSMFIPCVEAVPRRMEAQPLLFVRIDGEAEPHRTARRQAALATSAELRYKADSDLELAV